MEESELAASSGPRRPAGLLLVLVLLTAGMLAAALYAQRLSAQRSNLQRQLAAAERRALDLREQLTKAELAVQEKDAELASREVALAEATQPELPVRVTFRPAWMGQGMVAMFHNVGTEPLTLMVEFRDPNLHVSRDFALAVDPGATADVGHAQGWLVNTGQSVRVSAAGFKAVSAFAP